MTAILAVPVPIEVMAMVALGPRMVADRPVGFDAQGPAAPCIDVVRAATVELSVMSLPIFTHAACPACSVQQSGHAGGVPDVVITGTPDTRVPGVRSAGRGSRYRPVRSSASRRAVDGRLGRSTMGKDTEEGGKR
jgi:hypothetical protein